jgi:hypothetical protein
VEYLRAKIEKEERKEWMNLSLTSAMRGMEEEELTLPSAGGDCAM